LTVLAVRGFVVFAHDDFLMPVDGSAHPFRELRALDRIDCLRAPLARRTDNKPDANVEGMKNAAFARSA
jgi:hypothetical protein